MIKFERVLRSKAHKLYEKKHMSGFTYRIIIKLIRDTNLEIEKEKNNNV